AHPAWPRPPSERPRAPTPSAAGHAAHAAAPPPPREASPLLLRPAPEARPQSSRQRRGAVPADGACARAHTRPKGLAPAHLVFRRTCAEAPSCRRLLRPPRAPAAPASSTGYRQAARSGSTCSCRARGVRPPHHAQRHSLLATSCLKCPGPARPLLARSLARRTAAGLRATELDRSRRRSSRPPRQPCPSLGPKRRGACLG